MGFSCFVELKSARFVERKTNEKEFIRDIVKDLYLFGKVLSLLLRVFDSPFSLSLYCDASLKTLL